MRTYLKSFLEAQSIVSFQDSATPVIEGIIDLHHNIFYYSIIITALVMWMLRQILVKYNYVWDFPKNSNDINERKNYLLLNNILFHLFLFFFLFCYTTIILYYMCFFDFFILYYNRYFVDKIIINLFLLISLIFLYINFSKFNKSAFLCYFFSFIILFIKVNFLFSQMTVLSCLNISFFLYLSVTNINYYVYIYCMSNMKDKLPEKSIMKNSKFSRLFDNFKYILLFLLCEVFMKFLSFIFIKNKVRIRIFLTKLECFFKKWYSFSEFVLDSINPRVGTNYSVYIGFILALFSALFQIVFWKYYGWHPGFVVIYFHVLLFTFLYIPFKWAVIIESTLKNLDFLYENKIISSAAMSLKNEIIKAGFEIFFYGAYKAVKKIVMDVAPHFSPSGPTIKKGAGYAGAAGAAAGFGIYVTEQYNKNRTHALEVQKQTLEVQKQTFEEQKHADYMRVKDREQTLEESKHASELKKQAFEEQKQAEATKSVTKKGWWAIDVKK